MSAVVSSSSSFDCHYSKRTLGQTRRKTSDVGFVKPSEADMDIMSQSVISVSNIVIRKKDSLETRPFLLIFVLFSDVEIPCAKHTEKPKVLQQPAEQNGHDFMSEKDLSSLKLSSILKHSASIVTADLCLSEATRAVFQKSSISLSGSNILWKN